MRGRDSRWRWALPWVLVCASAAQADSSPDAMLRQAAQEGDLSGMQRALERGALPDRAYALYAAVEGRQLAAVQWLLEQGADPNVWTRLYGRVASSPLYVAASLGSRPIVACLLAHGADVEAESGERLVPATVLAALVADGNLQGAQWLIDAGARVNHTPPRSRSPLFYAIGARRNRAALVALLLDHGANPDMRFLGVSLREEMERTPELARLLATAPATTGAVMEVSPATAPPAAPAPAGQVQLALPRSAPALMGSGHAPLPP